MEKKIKFSDKGTVQKIVYLTVIAILCVSAIVIGIVASNNRKTTDPENPDNVGEVPGGDSADGTQTPDGQPSETPDENQNTPAPTLAFVSPAVGTVIKSHSATVPVFSNTLDEWRIHTGLDVSTEEGAKVVSVEAGEVLAVYKHPMLGYTVEIKHSDTHKSVYQNLNADSVTVKVGDKVSKGDVIACVGDSTVIELADEPHLHFELMVNDVSVNPLDYFTAESLKASLGIE
jgi:murein DD-endopeptidase MepM/ murein hydrolase activator NlpD